MKRRQHITTYASGLTIESYDVRPDSGGRAPGSLGLDWPTGFSGGGWLVRDAAGDVVYAHAWRRFCLEYAGEPTD